MVVVVVVGEGGESMGLILFFWIFLGFDCRLLDHEHQQQSQPQPVKMYEDAGDAASAAAQYLLPPSNTAHLLNNGDLLWILIRLDGLALLPALVQSPR